MDPAAAALGAGLPVVCAAMMGAIVALVYCDGAGCGVLGPGEGIGRGIGIGIGIARTGALGVVTSGGLMAGDGVAEKCACGSDRTGVATDELAECWPWPGRGGAGEVEGGGGVGPPGLAAKAAAEKGEPGCDAPCGRLAAR
jgi:hypothetical protein